MIHATDKVHLTIYKAKQANKQREVNTHICGSEQMYICTCKQQK